jgi:hypothetical protein
MGPSVCQNSNVVLSNQPVYTELEIQILKARHLTQAMFKLQSSYGEAADREWLIYSPSQGKVYYFVWKLFSHTDSAFNTSGFNDWKHVFNAVSHHEN